MTRTTRTQLRRIARRLARLVGAAPTTSASPVTSPVKPPHEPVLLASCGLFDLDWYSAEAAEEFSDLDAAVKHYRTIGAKMQLSPNPFFDPSVLSDGSPMLGRTPLGIFLRSKHVWDRSPHPAWAIAKYLERNPQAADHLFGPLGHFYERLQPDTRVDLTTPDGPVTVPWADVSPRWREFATNWTHQRRLRRPGLTTQRPDEATLANVPRAVETPDTLVSIIIPTWNRARSLRLALESAQAQTWRHWEALVIDDGSDDDTLAVVREMSVQDPRIRLLPRPHEGVSAARNTGLAAARGGFVAFLDSDNTWMPAYLERMVCIMQARALNAAYGTLMKKSSEGVRYRAAQVDREILMVANHIDMNVLVVRASLMRDIGGFDVTLRRTVDYDLVLRIAEHADLVHIPVVGVLYDDDMEASDRISVRETPAWTDLVRLKHLVDWDHEAALDRAAELVSVVLPVHARPEELLARLEAVRIALGTMPWEAVVVDHTDSRAMQNAMVSTILTDDRVQYLRIPMRVSYAYAADAGFILTRGARVIFVDFDAIPEPGAIRALLNAAGRETTPYVLQPVTIDTHGTVVTAGAVFSPWHTLPTAFLAGRPIGDLDIAGDETVTLEALGGRTFMTRATDFIRARGLDPLLDNELELTDLGMRLSAGDPTINIGLVPSARVRHTTYTRGGSRTPATHRIFLERHGTRMSTPPEDLWTRWRAGLDREAGR
jgi:GT2 family glycosyltransferase